MASRKGLVLPGAESSHLRVLSPACTTSCSTFYHVPGDTHLNLTPCLPRCPSMTPHRPPLTKISLLTKSYSILCPRHGHPPSLVCATCHHFLQVHRCPLGRRPFLISSWLGLGTSTQLWLHLPSASGLCPRLPHFSSDRHLIRVPEPLKGSLAVGKSRHPYGLGVEVHYPKATPINIPTPKALRSNRCGGHSRWCPQSGGV